MIGDRILEMVHAEKREGSKTNREFEQLVIMTLIYPNHSKQGLVQRVFNSNNCLPVEIFNLYFRRYGRITDSLEKGDHGRV
jgi:hypothetical protein